METSNEINELATALAKAQAAIGTVGKNAKNPHFKSNYADLAAVREACIPQLNAEGLAVVQLPGRTESGEVSVTTRLIHTSGQWIQSTVSAPMVRGNDAQAAGSVITYLRRYSLAALTGLAQEDDDGNAAAGRSMPPAKASTNGSAAPVAQPPADFGALLAGFTEATNNAAISKAATAVKRALNSLTREQKDELNKARDEAKKRVNGAGVAA